MVSWFKHHIPEWMNGTEALEDGPYRVYHVVCQLIYLHDGPIALNEIGIAGRCKQHILTFRKNLASLIRSKKLTLVDGKLSNARAEIELDAVGHKRASSAKGGRNSAGVPKTNLGSTSGQPGGGVGEVESRSGGGQGEVGSRSRRGQADNLLKTNGTATVLLLDTQHHKRREEKIREEKKDAANAAPQISKAPDARVYARGREVLGKESGGLIKKLIAAKENNLALAMAAVETASTKHDPREYIGKIIAGDGDRYENLDPRFFSSYTVR